MEAQKMETKHEKFLRLAESRTNSALKQISLLGNLANTKNYDYTSEEFDQITKTLKDAVKQLELQVEYNQSALNSSFKIK